MCDMPMRPLVALLAVLSACASPTSSVAPPPDQIGNRVRILIEGRDVESITSADYFLYCVVRTREGQRHGIRTLLPESVSSPGSALSIATGIERKCGLPDVEIREGTDKDPKWSSEFVLPEGYSLCCELGAFYAYRIVDGGPAMRADLTPEVRLQVSSQDGSSYFDVPPSDGPGDPTRGDAARLAAPIRSLTRIR